MSINLPNNSDDDSSKRNLITNSIAFYRLAFLI